MTKPISEMQWEQLESQIETWSLSPKFFESAYNNKDLVPIDLRERYLGTVAEKMMDQENMSALSRWLKMTGETSHLELIFSHSLNINPASFRVFVNTLNKTDIKINYSRRFFEFEKTSEESFKQNKIENIIYLFDNLKSFTFKEITVENNPLQLFLIGRTDQEQSKIFESIKVRLIKHKLYKPSALWDVLKVASDQFFTSTISLKMYMKIRTEYNLLFGKDSNRVQAYEQSSKDYFKKMLDTKLIYSTAFYNSARALAFLVREQKEIIHYSDFIESLGRLSTDVESDPILKKMSDRELITISFYLEILARNNVLLDANNNFEITNGIKDKYRLFLNQRDIDHSQMLTHFFAALRNARSLSYPRSVIYSEPLLYFWRNKNLKKTSMEHENWFQTTKYSLTILEVEANLENLVFVIKRSIEKNEELNLIDIRIQASSILNWVKISKLKNKEEGAAMNRDKVSYILTRLSNALEELTLNQKSLRISNPLSQNEVKEWIDLIINLHEKVKSEILK